MTYNEWRDELKNNLLTVTDAERRRVLDYYAEAYADRREAGFTEREIIEGFGAPYDAAQRILYENSDDYYREESPRSKMHRENTDRRNHTQYDEGHREERDTFYAQEENAHRQEKKRSKEKSTESNWLFVLLCVVLAIPIFALVMSMVGITIGLCVAPFGIVTSGIGTICAGIGVMFSNILSGILTLGEGILVLGVGILLFPLCFKLAKWMWKLFKMFFKWLKQLCSGEKA
ncbi:MAG: DUF1700 domain-containing protein [Clostridiales bacterium]|nr:DUF1700 domain-containing protein [Clostridiales bacterium]